MNREVRDAVMELLDAAKEITCSLDHPEAWNLDWFDAIALDRAIRKVESLL